MYRIERQWTLILIVWPAWELAASSRVYATVSNHGHRHCRQTRADQQFIIVPADLQISNVRADPQNFRHSPTIEIINNI